MKSFTQNASWNIVAGLSSALLTVAMPPILTRVLDADLFSGWALALQVAAYLNIINLGVQTIIGREVAAADAVGDTARRDRVVATSVAIFLVIGLVEVIAIGVAAQYVGYFAPDAPDTVQPQIAAVMVLLAMAFAVQLPVSTFGAVFIGLQRNDLYAMGMIALRVVTTLLVLAFAITTRDVVAMAAAWLAATLLCGALIIGQWLAYSPQPRLTLAAVSRPMVTSLLASSYPFLVWNVSILFVTGVQILIVARVDFASVGMFSTAAALSTFVPGIIQAVTSTVVARTASARARGENDAILTSLDRVTVLSLILSAGLAGTLIPGADFVARLWLGPIYTAEAGLIIVMLVFAQSLRGTMLAYTMTAVSCGLERPMLWSPIVEGLAAVGFSLWLGRLYGPAGVAAGTVLGIAVGVALIAAQALLRRALPRFAMRPYLLRQVLRPSLGLIVMTVISIAWHDPGNVWRALLILVIGAALTVVMTRAEFGEYFAFIRARIGRA